MVAEDVTNGELLSGYVFGVDFDGAKTLLESEGYGSIISLPQNARFRIQEGPNSFISQNGNLTREAFLYIPGKGCFLTKKSPLLSRHSESAIAEIMSARHSYGIDDPRRLIEFPLTDEQIEEALSEAVKIRSASIPAERLGDDETTVFAFEESSRAYGEFLKANGVHSMPIYLDDRFQSLNKPAARQVYFHDILRMRSAIHGYQLGKEALRGVRNRKTESEERFRKNLRSIRGY